MGEGRGRAGRGDREFVHARWRNRTMERLTCVGGPVVYRTGIICPPPIARLNYSSRDEPGQQTLHCFNRSPIIRQLLELQPTTTTTTNQRWLYPGHGTIRRRYACTRARIKPLFHPSPLSNYASTRFTRMIVAVPIIAARRKENERVSRMC